MYCIAVDIEGNFDHGICVMRPEEEANTHFLNIISQA